MNRILVCLLLVLGACTAREDAGPTPVHDDETLHVVGFGDSVTAGYCADPGRSYVELLVNDTHYDDYKKRDLTHHYGEVVVSNRAISGTTSCNYTASAIRSAIQAEVVPNADQTVVLITLGGNDLIHDYACFNPRECASYCSTLADATVYAANYKARMKSFFDVFKQELPNTEIFIANIYDPTDGVGDIENAPIPLPPWPEGLQVLALYNQTIAELADEDPQVHLVDMHGAMFGHGIHHDDPASPAYDADDPSYWYCYNLEDPNNRGYHEIRKAFWERVALVLNIEK